MKWNAVGGARPEIHRRSKQAAQTVLGNDFTSDVASDLHPLDNLRPKAPQIHEIHALPEGRRLLHFLALRRNLMDRKQA